MNTRRQDALTQLHRRVEHQHEGQAQRVAQWELNELLALINDLNAAAPAPHERFVRCSIELVEQLKAAPSEPVTVAVHERESGELYFIFTRQECTVATRPLPCIDCRGVRELDQRCSSCAPEADPKPAAAAQQSGNGNEKGAERSAPGVG